jgi:O-acetyl-ADP-ribose deacetylase (regulator of RNase III)
MASAAGTENWTNPSVLLLAEGADPIKTITARARQLVLDALDAGWAGPPFDPFELAHLLGVPVVAREDQFDARTVVVDAAPADSRGLRIEFNPNRPPGRLRWSVVHEIAHTFFPDVAEEVRHRTGSGAVPTGQSDFWQLELLCNIAAAELLMPAAIFDDDLDSTALDIDALMELRSRYSVSAEALVRRAVERTQRPAALLALARDETGAEFRIDYVVPSRSWAGEAPMRGMRFLSGPPLGDCTAVGYTTRGLHTFPTSPRSFDVQAVGIPGYPGDPYPRVLALLTPLDDAASRTDGAGLQYVTGDVTKPRGPTPRLIAHVVSDRAHAFGPGVASALGNHFRNLRESYRNWTIASPENLRLGNVHTIEVEEGTWVSSMVAQEGFGPANEPRIRYHALTDCLHKIAKKAAQLDASIHVPRIGAGQAGGSWPVVADLLDREVCRAGVPVTVYTRPGEHPDALERQSAARSQSEP